MAYAINLRSDDGSADVVRLFWKEFATLESSPSMEALAYPPHITLAIYDSIQPDTLLSAFEHAVADVPRFSAKFERLGYFEAPHAMILWAAPTIPGFVNIVHSRIHAVAGPDASRPHYRPGNWVPHCSLATAIDVARKDEVIDITNRPLEPFEVVFDVADCVSFLPVQVLHEQHLRADV